MTPVLQGLVPLSRLGKLFDPRSGTKGFFPTISQCLMSPSSSELKAPLNIFFLQPMLTARTDVPLPIP